MNNTKVCNPKTEVPTGIKENDKDYLNSCLSLLKDMEKNYTITLTEVSNESLFEKYDSMFNSIKSLQREVFELAFVNGWYTLERAEDTKIIEKYNILKQEFESLNN
ncbi:MAG: spore coat protein [Bacilli bacterium]